MLQFHYSLTIQEELRQESRRHRLVLLEDHRSSLKKQKQNKWVGKSLSMRSGRDVHVTSSTKLTLLSSQMILGSLKPQPIDRNISTQHIATLLGATCCVRLATMLRHVGCCWLKFDHFQIWANNTQHVATHRNTVAKRTQHVAPNNVGICCVGMLRSFGRGFTVDLLSISFPRDLRCCTNYKPLTRWLS